MGLASLTNVLTTMPAAAGFDRDDDRRIRHRRFIALLMAAGCALAAGNIRAQTLAPSDEAAAAWQAALPLPERGAAPGIERSWSADIARNPDSSGHAFLWRNLGRLSFGLGVEQRWQLDASAGGGYPRSYNSSELLLGVTLRSARWPTLTLQSAPAEWAAPNLEQRSERAPGFIELKSSDPYRAFRRGALKMDLGDDSSLSLRLRAKKVLVQYSKTW